ncbi:MAG: hypothetical protein FWD47_11780 [Treponema sp.]|nr:hypothetical protein [Treponema sp.]
MRKVEYIVKNIPSFLTIITGVFYFFYNIFTKELTTFQIIVLSVLVLICITFVVERMLSLGNIENGLEKILNHIPKDSIIEFRTSEECIDEMEHLYKKTKHSIRSANLDYEHRSYREEDFAKDRLTVVRDKFAANEKIEYQYLVYPTPRRIENVRRNIANDNTRKKKSFYAMMDISVNKTEQLPFASFMIFDGEHIIVRSPYEIEKSEPYLLITHPLISAMFNDWFDKMWKRAEEIENIAALDCYIGKNKKSDGVIA